LKKNQVKRQIFAMIAGDKSVQAMQTAAAFWHVFFLDIDLQCGILQ